MIVGTDVVLRLIEREDSDLVVKWRNNPRVKANLFGRMPLSRAGHNAWFEAYQRLGQEMVFIIETLEHVPVGTVGLSKIDHQNQSAEFGRMLIGEDSYIGRGLASDATITLLRFAFSELNLNRVFLEVFSFNDDAVETYRRCGFEIEGTKRECIFTRGSFFDVVVMSVLRQDFIRKFGGQ